MQSTQSKHFMKLYINPGFIDCGSRTLCMKYWRSLGKNMVHPEASCRSMCSKVTKLWTSSIWLTRCRPLFYYSNISNQSTSIIIVDSPLTTNAIDGLHDLAWAIPGSHIGTWELQLHLAHNTEFIQMKLRVSNAPSSPLQRFPGSICGCQLLITEQICGQQQGKFPRGVPVAFCSEEEPLVDPDKDLVVLAAPNQYVVAVYYAQACQLSTVC